MDECPYDEPLHDHHDGCPSCYLAELESAIKNAYSATEKITFTGKFFRTDIGKKGLIPL